MESVISDLSADHKDSFHVVRLNGFIHTDDKIASKEIWRQLGKEMDAEDDAPGKVGTSLCYLVNLLTTSSTAITRIHLLLSSHFYHILQKMSKQMSIKPQNQSFSYSMSLTCSRATLGKLYSTIFLTSRKHEKLQSSFLVLQPR